MFQTENGFIGVGPVAEGLMMNDGYYNAGGIPYIPLPGGVALIRRCHLALFDQDGWQLLF